MNNNNNNSSQIINNNIAYDPNSYNQSQTNYGNLFDDYKSIMNNSSDEEGS
jgi:hypothetical protein